MCDNNERTNLDRLRVLHFMFLAIREGRHSALPIALFILDQCEELRERHSRPTILNMIEGFVPLGYFEIREQQDNIMDNGYYVGIPEDKADWVIEETKRLIKEKTEEDFFDTTSKRIREIILE